jgi:ATP-dependent Clp protease ATP-binding subunit ClpC
VIYSIKNIIKYMNNQFSQKVADIIAYSKEEAHRLMNSSIQPAHFLLGIIREANNKAIELLEAMDLDIEAVKAILDDRLRNHQDTDISQLDYSTESQRILKLCVLEARLMKSDATDPEHLLLAILRDKKNNAAELLSEYDINYENAVKAFNVKPDTNAGFGVGDSDEDEEDENQWKAAQNTQKRKKENQQAASSTPILDNFGTDLTIAAEEGKLDPVVGREKEITRLAQILCRRKKNNPILIGEPGVGKSAIVEGLAMRIVERKVSRILYNKRVVILDMTAVVAGTKYRGQFEERIRSIVNELKKNPDVIIFIDEIHTIVGAGSAPGTMDAANMLKPALARGEIQCIGATTLDEYRKNIEKDTALERRFQKIVVSPTTADETLQILNNIKEKYEEHHNVTYTPEAIKACVQLADRYISDRFFPDKAIDVLDESGSRVHLTTIAAPKALEDQEKLVDELKEKKNEAVKQQNFELAADFRDQEKENALQLEKLRKEWEEEQKKFKQVVDESQIADVVSLISGVPVQRIAKEEGIQLTRMKEQLNNKVIAQHTAVDKVVRAIQRSRTGLKDPNRPIGTFMFLGPTGVGKTLLAKELAKNMFGSEEAIIRIDMSEYMEKFTVSRLIGAPPGYVGYEEGGQLSEKVRRRPYSIVLLDEIEKAHADVFNILLQIMDEGRLTDSYGRNVDFKNTIVIMTSNVGSRQVKEHKNGIGFGIHSVDKYAEMTRGIIQKALQRSFSPEFLNRIDEIINFEQLRLEDIKKIVKIELNELSSRVNTLGYELNVTEEAQVFLAEKGYDIQYGARPLKRAIQTHLEDLLAEMIINLSLSQGDTLEVLVDKEKDALKIEKQPQNN